MYIGYLHRKKLVETFENYSIVDGEKKKYEEKNFNFLAALLVHNLYTYRILKNVWLKKQRIEKQFTTICVQYYCPVFFEREEARIDPGTAASAVSNEPPHVEDLDGPLEKNAWCLQALIC